MSHDLFNKSLFSAFCDANLVVLEIEEFGPTGYPDLTVNGLDISNQYDDYTFEQCEAQLATSSGGSTALVRI